MFEDLYVRVAAENLEAEADLLAAHGAAPEIFVPAGRLRAVTPRERAAWRRLLSPFAGHTLHAPFMDVWPGAADDPVRALSLDTMRRAMALAGELNSRLVVMHYNYDPIYYRWDLDGWLERAAGFYDALLREFPGPLIALENIADPTPYVALRLVEKADQPRLVHCFDFGHHHVFASLPFREWLHYLRPRGHIHFHIHDNRGDSDDHLAPGAGNIDWKEARAALAVLGCPFSVALEPKSAAGRDAALAYYREHFLAAGKSSLKKG